MQNIWESVAAVALLMPFMFFFSTKTQRPCKMEWQRTRDVPRVWSLSWQRTAGVFLGIEKIQPDVASREFEVSRIYLHVSAW